MDNKFNNIPKERFQFVKQDNIHDSKLKTKPVGYYKDAWRRFKKNKASVVAACIILALILIAIITPLIAPFAVSFSDAKYQLMIPKNPVLSHIGIGTGTKSMRGNQNAFDRRVAIGAGAEDPNATKYNHFSVPQSQWKSTGTIAYDDGIGSKYAAVLSDPTEIQLGPVSTLEFNVDAYMEVGFDYRQVNMAEIEKILAFEHSTGLKVLYPLIDLRNIPDLNDQNNPNLWFLVQDGKFMKDNDGNFISNYLLDSDGAPVYWQRTGSVATYKIRVLYYNYFQYVNGREPIFILGTNELGQDLLIRVTKGIQTSLMLAVFVAVTNFVLGTIIGALEGYYGGTFDLIMERIKEILLGLPSMVYFTLFKFHFVNTNRVSPFGALIFAYIIMGWVSTSSSVRRQFYRFKGHEYVLAARTLGASDFRLMSKHIFPNGIGTIITTSVLTIPGVIFGESSLAYLNIINISGPNTSSLGAILGSGREYLTSFPHILLWPSIIISLLLISFNLFGNGLRDAFNPSLRGVEE